MPKVCSLDFVLLETSIFGVNQGYTGRFVGPDIAWILGVFNLCNTVMMTYLIFSGEYFRVDDHLSINFIAQKVYYCIISIVTMIIQIRHLLRRQQMASVGRELYGLYQLSTWNGDICGCIARIVHYFGWYMLFHCLPMYAKEWDGRMVLHLQHMIFCWSNFAPAAAAEFIGQAMLLVQYEFEVLSKIAKGIATRKDFRMEKLRALNRRHASLFALANRVTRFNGIESLVIIESEKFLILVSIFIEINLSTVLSFRWTTILLNCAFHGYRLERITHYCFRGQRIVMEANRFVSLLDEINPLDLGDDHFLTEIIRKQMKLRKLQFDCNRFLKLDIKLILHILKDLLTMIIILVQLTTNPPIVTPEQGNATEADNATGYFRGFSDMDTNSSTAQYN